MNEKKKSIKVQNEDTLLNILVINLKNFSKKDIKKLFKYGQVAVDGKIETNSSKLVSCGRIVTINFNKKSMPSIGFNILYEDENLIAIDKPQNLLSISTSKEGERTAYRMVSDYVKTGDKHAKIFVVHRLDKDTSGVLVFAKNKKTKDSLQDNWNYIVKKREYVAVIDGELKNSGTIKSYLTTDNFQKVYSTKNTKIGKLAITNYEPIKSKNGKTLIKLNIETGRKNQIRVHMSEFGYPIVGDRKYGSKSESINRLALHASKLEFINPNTNSILTLESKIPSSFHNLLK